MAVGTILRKKAGVRSWFAVAILADLRNTLHYAFNMTASAGRTGMQPFQGIGGTGVIKITHAIITIMACLTVLTSCYQVGGGEIHL